MLRNIPTELTNLRQWIAWRYENVNGSSKPTKVPYQINKSHASVTNPSTWNSFDAVCNACSDDGYFSGIGFVFTESDAYTGIDLDGSSNQELHKSIYDRLNSYSELSPSGNGVHIIVRGKVPRGRKNAAVEIYSQDRFFTFTGNVLEGRTTINDCSEAVIQVYNEQFNTDKESVPIEVNEDEKSTDDQIFTMASTAANGSKFQLLWDGHWTDQYPSQSEADLAIINIFAFYTKNRTQIIRLFHRSKLGKRTKARRTDYLNWMLDKAFDQTLPHIDLDFEGFKASVKAAYSTPVPQFEASPLDDFDLDKILSAPTREFHVPPPPEELPGLIGAMARYAYYAAPHAMWEASLAMAISTLAGVGGRMFRYLNSTSPLYTLIVANTGMGKEAARSARDTLFRAVRATGIVYTDDFIGPSHISSGQALNKVLEKQPCCLSILGEFGLTLQRISGSKASSTDQLLYGLLLSLYGTGDNSTGGVAYADTDKNISSIQAPAFSILGDTTPETFYEVIDEKMIATGLMPRFLIFDYDGKRQYENRDRIIKPSDELIKHLAAYMAYVKSTESAGMFINVKITQDAHNAIYNLSDYATDFINSKDKKRTANLWNRAKFKIQRLATLMASGINHTDPTIDIHCIRWAAKLVFNDIKTIQKKYESGQIAGSLDSKQHKEILDAMRWCIENSWETVCQKYPGCGTKEMHAAKMVTHRMISNKLICAAPFRNDRVKASLAINLALKHLTEIHTITEVPSAYLKQFYGKSLKSFVFGDV